MQTGHREPMSTYTPGTFVYHDVGKPHRNKGGSDDCTVRALVIVARLTWDDSYDLLAAAQLRHPTPVFDLPLSLKTEPNAFGSVEQFDFPAKRGEKRTPPTTFGMKYPKGNSILPVANHVTAIEDGVVYDSWD